MNDTILVVGGGQGIGRAIADAHHERAVVWTRRGGVDATKPESLRAATEALTKQHGAPFAWIHCPGDFAEQPLLETDQATYRHLFASNVDTVFHTMHAVVPAMRAAKRGGRVILFAIAGVDKNRAMSRAPMYFAAKAAVVQIARSMALELAKDRITVNVIAPGLIDHEQSHRDSQARMLPRVPAGRLGTVDDVLGLVDYLLAPAADYVTGQVLTIDGGLQA